MTPNDLLVTFAGYGFILSIIYIIKTIYMIVVNALLILTEDEKAKPVGNLFSINEQIITWFCLAYIITFIFY